MKLFTHWLALISLFLLTTVRPAQAQNVGIGTTAPTHTLDVNGALRVRGLTGSGVRLPQVQPDGTLSVTAALPATSTSAPNMPTTVSTVSLTLIGGLAVSGDYLYAAEKNARQLRVFSLASPATPTLVASMHLSLNSPDAIATDGTYLYVTNSGGDSLQVVNVSTPMAPASAALLPLATGGSDGVAVSGGYLYVATFKVGQQLQVYSLATPTAPSYVASQAVNGGVGQLAVAGGYLYAALFSTNQVQTFSLATPTAPVSQGTAAAGRSTNGALVLGQELLVTNIADNTVQRFSLAAPATPGSTATFAAGNNPYTLAADASGTYLYVGDTNGLRVLTFTSSTVLGYNSSGQLTSVPTTALGDNLGNHTATQNLNLGGNALVGTGNNIGNAVGVGITAQGGINIGQTTSGGNMFIGFSAGYNTTPATASTSSLGKHNQFVGIGAGSYNTTGYNNSFAGFTSGYLVTTGANNVYEGSGAGYNNSTGSFNVAAGSASGYNNKGSNNVLLGFDAGYNTLGSRNVYVGSRAGYANTAALTNSGTWGLGYQAGPSVSGLVNAGALGYKATVSQSNSLVLGSTVDSLAVHVGIGTTAPALPLEVAAGVGTGAIGLRGVTWDHLYMYHDGYTAVVRAGGADNGFSLQVGAGNSGTYGDASQNYVEGLRLLPNGNVGIGTATPGQKLEVAGQVYSNTGGFRFPDNTVQTTAFTGGDNLGNHTATRNLNLASYQLVGNGGTRGVSVSSGGNVGIGTTTPLAALHVDGAEGASTTAVGVTLGGGSNSNPNIELRSVGRTPYIDFAETSGVDFTTRLISQGGTLNVAYGGLATPPTYLLKVNGGLQCTSVNQTSDQRLKTQVRPLTGALAAVLALRGVRYRWNALGVQHGGTAGAEQVGLLAQELEQVYPELVSTDAQGYKAVNYAQLTPVLLEALKEQQQQIQALQAQVAGATRQASQATAAQQADHADLQTLKAQLARLLGEPSQASAR
jgi:hypothetical protein